MDNSHPMVHAEQIEEKKLKQVCGELKNVRTEQGNSSKNSFKVQDKPGFKKRFSNKGHLIEILRCVLESNISLKIFRHFLRSILMNLSNFGGL